MRILILSVGGTIDKVYFDEKSEYEVGEPTAPAALEEANVTVEYEWRSALRKDSLDMSDDDRQLVFDAIAAEETDRVVVTHGTDTMILTAKKLQGIPGKTIVLTGSMQPARFRDSDAVFNIGFALGAVQTLAPGVYIAMNGRIFSPDRVRKNVDMNRFEDA